MGCGGSKAVETSNFQKSQKSRKSAGHSLQSDGSTLVDLENSRNGTLTRDRNGNARQLPPLQPAGPAKAPVAFEVNFQESDQEESLIKKHPPKRFQRLEPLPGTKLTAEMLADKQREAEERKERQLQRRAKSAQRSERRRQQALENKKRILEEQEASAQ